ncbi:hypothetical protein [Planktotalea arctica]|uniref:hypothetical protein n=1 Tax=Planktotalea arctica TaxID=1481893 RepID=UPI00111C7780|nr:hypothetical protein [Planktotalea arctica]
MQHDFMHALMFRQPQASLMELAVLEIVIADAGYDNGIDVTIYAVGSGQIVFDTILVDPDSQVLLTHGSPETEAFWQRLNLHCCIDVVQNIFVTARCRFSPLTIAVSTKRIGPAETRNVRFLRLVEALLDELQTRRPSLTAQVAVTHSNPSFDRCFKS